MIIGVDASRANVSVLTGTERYAFEVLCRLPFQRPDVRWRYYLREQPHPRWGRLPSNVEWRVLTWRPRWLWTHLRLATELWRHRPNALFIPVGAIPLRPRLPTATTIHDVAFERYPELYGGSVVTVPGWARVLLTGLVRLVTLGRSGLSQLEYQRWSVRRAVRAEVLFSVSEFTKRECVTLLSAPPGKFVVTPLAAVDWGATLSADVSAGVLQTYNLMKPYAVVVGRMEKKKNIDGVLAAYRQFADQHPGALDLVLIGAPGYGWEQARHLIPDAWVGHSVHILGQLPEPDRSIIQSHAKLLLFVSRYEGFGLPVIEAMQAGVPVVAAQGSAIPEVAGSAAVLVPPEDRLAIAEAMARVVTDGEFRTDLILRGRRQAKKFSWDATTAGTAAGLDRLLLLQSQKSGRVKPA